MSGLRLLLVNAVPGVFFCVVGSAWAQSIGGVPNASNMSSLEPSRPLWDPTKVEVGTSWRNDSLVYKVYSNASSLTQNGESPGKFLQISELQWQSSYPTFYASLHSPISLNGPDDFVEVWFAPGFLQATDPMVDLDWTRYQNGFDTVYPNYGDPDGFTYKTESANTVLDIAIGIDLRGRSNFSSTSKDGWTPYWGTGLAASVHKWTANGAKGSYSKYGLFDTPVDIPASRAAVSATHWRLDEYAVLGTAYEQDVVTVDVALKAGVGLSYLYDQHHLRDLEISSLGGGWSVGVNGEMHYQLSSDLSVELGVEYSYAVAYGLWRENVWAVGSNEHPDGKKKNWRRGQDKASIIDTYSSEFSVSLGAVYKF